ncbi:MAG: hypothetical protein IPL86_07545 [Flavobacteriales bacterium]|nr:hypothetical protein [Flavobacteriales bacterium]
MYGVIPIPVEDAATHITPEITAPPAIKTDEQFSVSVSEKDGKAMTYTLAIDEGLLTSPDSRHPIRGTISTPRKRWACTWDVYDQVIGAFGQQLRRILALGGSDQASPADATKAQRFKPVVHFVGPFKLEKGKKATHQFTISNYVGSVRIMVVASTPQAAYGSAEKAVPVRKPLMLLATLPRVTGPGETVDLPVAVFAMEAKVKNVQLALEANDLFTVIGSTTQALTFSTTGEQTVMFRVKRNERIGVGKVTLTATGAGEKATQSIEVDVRQAGSPETEATETVLEAGQSWEASPQALGVGGTNSGYLS